MGFPCGYSGKESACNVGDLGLIPGLRRTPGEGKGYPLQYSGLENSMDYVYSPWGCKESDRTEWLSLSLWASLIAQLVKNLPAVQETGVWSLGREDSLKKEMATHSSILAWRIPWTEEPGSPWGCKESDTLHVGATINSMWKSWQFE